MSFMEDFGIFLSRTFSDSKAVKLNWPFVPGKYFVIDPAAPVAVTTLGSVRMAEALATYAPEGLCISGKVETENIGIEKIVKNIITNPSIRFLVCCGAEVPKHRTGATLLALFKNGMDKTGRITDAPGMRPVLRNTTKEEIDLLRQQVEIIDMVGCVDLNLIIPRVKVLAVQAPRGRYEFRPSKNPLYQKNISHIVAKAPSPERIKLDKGGYCVINITEDKIQVEHYDYKDRLLHVVEGKDARSIYWTLIEKGWVTRLDHAAYLGKELARAEISIKNKTEFTQDGA